MTRTLLVGVGMVALASSLALAQRQPEDLLPPGFDNPAPAPSPAPAPRPATGPAPRIEPQPIDPAQPIPTPGEVVQPIPGAAPDPTLDLSGLPSLEELESMTTDELDDLLGLKPRYDIPPAARRSMERVGIIGGEEGGMPVAGLANQPASLVSAALAGSNGRFVSRWGHILVRRTLASRLNAPAGMNPAEFAALRAGLLNRMGEHTAARALVQDVDTGNYTNRLTAAALDAYIGTSDIVGACPAVRLSRSDRDDGEWRMMQAICNAFAGEESRAGNDLRRILNSGSVPQIDALLAQRYAGAAGNGRRAVNIEWDDVEDMTPFRFALANALGEPVPAGLRQDLSPALRRSAALTPALGLPDRIDGADYAGGSGVMSARAMVDLYSQIYTIEELDGEAADAAALLREAYVGDDPTARLQAIRSLWEVDDTRAYGRRVLTAYAAARLPANSNFSSDAAALLGSMLAAGLDRDAARWSNVVSEGSHAWGILAVALPDAGTASDGQMADFLGEDDSTGQHRSRMLLAGLAGLGRLSDGDISEYAGRLSVDFARQSRWTQAITRAARQDNPALVSLLAGLGMQGSSWQQMTALHLYHIVRSLEAVGLGAEARMIAAEAVART